MPPPTKDGGQEYFTALFARPYQIIEELGKGKMGRVYNVFDTEIKEKIALKLLKLKA